MDAAHAMGEVHLFVDENGKINADITNKKAKGGKANEPTRDDYEEYLNEVIQPDIEDDQWIIGGHHRGKAYYNRYGAAIRKHDPIAFNVGYHDYVREKR